MSILTDPGHGGKDSGAVSKDGYLLEKDVVLKVGSRINHLLDIRGLSSGMTRTDDSFITLQNRVQDADRRGADILSIHCNAGGGSGIEVFTTHGQTDSDEWATLVLEELSKEFPNQVLRTDYSDGDPDKEAKFTVLRNKKSAILVELGFIDTAMGKAFLADSLIQERLAQAVVKGTARFNGLSGPPRVPLTLSVEERLTRLEKLHPELNL